MPERITAGGRLLAAAIAFVGSAALAAQLGLALRHGATLGNPPLLTMWRFIGFFTILTNLLLSATMARIALGRWPGGAQASASAIGGAVFAIVVVGLVYHFILLDHVPELAGPEWWVDRTLHYAAPGLSFLFWLFFAPKDGLRWRDPLLWLVWPVGYLAYALGRGAIDGWYPYFFIDVATLGYPAAIGNAVTIAAVFFAAALTVVAAVRYIRRRTPGA